MYDWGVVGFRGVWVGYKEDKGDMGDKGDKEDKEDKGYETPNLYLVKL